MHTEGFFNLTYSFTRTEGHTHEFVCHHIHMISAYIAVCEEPHESGNEDLGKGKGDDTPMPVSSSVSLQDI